VKNSIPGRGLGKYHRTRGRVLIWNIEISKKRENSWVVSWLGMGVARVLRVNASKRMVGWNGEHPQSVW
jgi:hypothetical protein